MSLHKLSLRAMLAGLSLVSLALVILLAASALFSNQQLIQQQERLSDLLLPLEAAGRGMVVAINGLSDRHVDLLSATQLKALDKVSPAAPLADRFRREQKTIHTIAEQLPEVAALLLPVDQAFDRLLQEDDQLFQLQKERLDLLDFLEQQVVGVDQVVDDLQKAQETVQGKLRLLDRLGKRKMRKLVEGANNEAELRKSVADSLQSGQIEQMQLGEQLRWNVANLATLSRQMMLAKEGDSLRNLKSNQYDQLLQSANPTLTTLHQQLSQLPEMQTPIQQVMDDFQGLTAMLTEGDGSILSLRLRILQREEEMAQTRHQLDKESGQLTLAMEQLFKSVDALRHRIHQESIDVAANGRFSVIAAAIAVAAATLGFLLFFTRRLIQRTRPITTLLAEAARGDYTHRIPLLGIRDELETISMGINTMADSLSRTIRSVALQSDTVAACVGELVSGNRHLGENATTGAQLAQRAADENSHLIQEVDAIKNAIGQAGDTLDQVSWATEQLSSHINTIAAASEQASQNVSTMAAAAEEMTGNIQSVNTNLGQVTKAITSATSATREISSGFNQVRERCRLATGEAASAKQQVHDSQEVMVRLTSAVREIDKAISLIKTIADQTNMLALNASIEAAGAGEAGKGFAVVAGEVKELARQTADATRMIAQQITGIRTQSDSMAQAGEQIAAGVERIHQANSGILQAVDDQTLLTEAISRAMEEVNQSTGMVTVNARELELAAQEVARAAAEAALGTQEIARSSADSATMANSVAQQSTAAKALAMDIFSAAERTAAATGTLGQQTQESATLSTRMNTAVQQMNRLVEVIDGTSDSLRQTQTGLEIGPPPFDVRRIKGGYLTWLSRLQQVLLQPDPEIERGVTDPARCTLLQWAEQEAQHLRHLPQFQEALTIIRQIHTWGRELVTSDRRHQNNEALLLRLYQTGDQLFDLLDGIYQTTPVKLS